MDIDMAVLRMLAAEREISLDVLVTTLEDAMLLAYSKTEGASRRARVELDRKSGRVTVWALEDLGPDAEGEPREYDDTPSDFGRIAASTARQVITQRMRDVEDESVLGDFKDKEGEILSGVIQQSPDPRKVLVDLGGVEGELPAAEQVPGERYVHGERIRCSVVAG